MTKHGLIWKKLQLISSNKSQCLAVPWLRILDSSISPEESGRNEDSEEEDFEEPSDIKAEDVAENVETENSDEEEFEEPTGIKIEDVAENVETENYKEKIQAFHKGHLYE